MFTMKWILILVVFLATSCMVSCYNDELSLCSATETIRCSQNMLPVQDPTSDQENLLELLRIDTFPPGGGESIPNDYSVCHRYTTNMARNVFTLYTYFSCSVAHGDCSRCYDQAADLLKRGSDGGGCSGRDGAFVSVGDNCCLRYERYKLCPS